MKLNLKYIWASLAFCTLFAGILVSKPLFAEEAEQALDALDAPAPQSELLVADFDSGDKPNNLGGDFGSWNKDPKDDTQGAYMTFVSDDALGN